MDSMPESKRRENLEIQLSELETLQSMFYNPGEVRIEDATVLTDIEAYVAGKTTLIPPFLDLTVNLQIDSSKFEMCINLSQEYPNTEPEIYVRNHKLTKHQHALLNKHLKEFVENLARNEPCIFTAISWLQDNASSYVAEDSKDENLTAYNKKEDEPLVRYWIYSHHIYSKTKRREIVDLACSLNITGFCMPGKPGIVCVEGATSDCNEWWQVIKAMNWKRIFCKLSEQSEPGIVNSRDFLRFDVFNEVVFQNNSIKCNHMDMGELYKFLDDHQCGHVFKEIFGVEAKLNN